MGISLSPRAIREIIIALVILLLAAALCVPDLLRDISTYNEQKAGGEGLKTSSPEQQGMDRSMLSLAGEYLKDTSAHSFIVLRHGFLVFDDYNGHSPDEYNNVYSVTKSVVSALTGIAIDKGYLKGTDDRVEQYLPGYYKGIQDPRWRDITLKHLLTMTPGFCEDTTNWTGSSDWVVSTFRLPLTYPPGEKFQYANSATHLMSLLLTRATGTDTRSFAQKYLFRPLGISSYKWLQDPQGIYTGFSFLYLLPRDMAKFGQLYLNNGRWGEEQVIPEAWVNTSTSDQYDLNRDENKGYENAYGFYWWINGETGYRMYSAVGYGGQSINVIPALDLVVVLTSEPGPGEMDDVKRFELLKKYVIPAIKDTKV